MAINKNHEFEDLDSIKCAIVEKNVSSDRATFLKDLLSYNKYEVVIVENPSASSEHSSSTLATQEAPLLPTTFTIGVTDLSFNPINAVFGRLLHTPDGHIVTLSYWQQKDAVSDDTVPYFDRH